MSQVMLKDLGIERCPGKVTLANIQIGFPRKHEDFKEAVLNRYLPSDVEENIFGLVRQASESGADLIVLPEFASSPTVEKRLMEWLKTQENDRIVVAGSYYLDGYNQSPILVKSGGKVSLFRQEKIFPSPFEKSNMKNGRDRILFVNTGMGDFGVFICYDANDWTIFPRMEKLVDFLIVIAHNRADGTFRNYFLRACYEHYYTIVYCNQAQYGGSSFFLPLHDAEKRQRNVIEQGKEGIVTLEVNLEKLDRSREGEKLEWRDGLSLAYPPANVFNYGARYRKERRGIRYFQKLVEQQEQMFLPMGIEAYIDIMENVQGTCPHCACAVRWDRLKYTVNIDRKSFKIGRNFKNNLSIAADHREISRHHATIFYRDGSFFYRDYSANRSKVDDVLLEKGQETKLSRSSNIYLAPKFEQMDPNELFLRFRLGRGEESMEQSTGIVTEAAPASPKKERLCPVCQKILNTRKISRILDDEEGSLAVHCLHTLPIFAQRADVFALGPDSERIAVAEEGKTIRTFHLGSGECLQVFQGHTAEVTGIAIGADNRHLVSSSLDKTVRVWDLVRGVCLHVLAHPHEVSSVVISGNDFYVVSGAWDGALRVWDLGTGLLVDTLQEHADRIASLRLSKNGKYLVSTSVDGMLKIWDLKEYGKVKTDSCLLPPHDPRQKFQRTRKWYRLLIEVEKTLESDKSPIPKYNYALCLYKIGSLPQALAYARKTLEVDPGWEKAIKLLTKITRKLEKK